MASSEDILIQFSAEDEITGIVEAMADSVSSAMDSIVSAVDSLDMGLSGLSDSAGVLSGAFSELESSMDSAEGSASNFQSTVDSISGDNISNISGEFDGLSSSIQSAEEEAGSLAGQLDSMDGSTVTIDIESNMSGGGEEWNADAELGGELTEQDTSALRTSMLDDITKVSSGIKDLGENAVASASAAEQGWLRFGNAVNNTGGNWDAQSDSIKSWVKDYSNSMGRGVADTRTAMTTFLNMGMGLDETQKTMEAVSNYAGQFGISQSEAAKMIQMSFMGAGRSIKKLGLDIKDFKDESGNVDKEKLLNAIMEKTSGAADKYANTYEARVQRMNNAINSLRTDFGKEIINVLEPLIPVVQQAFGAFQALPQPVKSAMLGMVGFAGAIAIVGGPLIKMKAYMNMAGVEISSLRNGLKTLQMGFKSLSSGGIKDAIKAMKDFQTAQKASQVMGGTAVGPATKVNLPNTGTMAKGTETVVKDGQKVASLSGPATNAGVGMKQTSVGLKSIGQGALSMVAPLIEIAIVVAIMIPIIAGLVAEALIFLKGIQLLLDALDFDSIDLTSTINSIKQIGQALLEMGIAMGAMAFSNVMTGLAVLTSGITGLINPVQVAGQLLIQAGQELSKFTEVNIDESIPDKLRKISDALNSVSQAMMSLTNVVLNMALGNLLTLGGLLGNVTDAMATARSEITNASNEIAKIKDLPDIEQGAVDKLKKISEALDSVSTAFSSLRSIRDGKNFDIGGWVSGLFGGFDIQSALNSIKGDIVNAGNALSNFGDVPDIPQGVGDKLKKIADSLKSVGEAMKSLRGVRDDMNWDNFMGALFGGMDIPSAISNAKSTLVTVANSLSSLQDLPTIPDGIYTKVQRIGTSAKNVGNVLKDMNNIPFPNIMGMMMIPINIRLSKSVLNDSALQLRTLQNLPAIPDGIYTKVQRIGTSTRNVANVLRIMSTANFPNIMGMIMIPINITLGKGVLTQSANALRGLQTIQPIPDGITAKISKVGSTTRIVANVLRVMSTANFPDVVSMALLPAKIIAAKGILESTSRELGNLTSVQNIPDGIAVKVQKVGTAARSVATAVQGIRSIPMVGPETAIKIRLAVSAVRSTVKELHRLQGLSTGGGIGQILNSVRTSVSQLRGALNAMRGGFRSTGVGISSSLKAGIHAGLGGLRGVVSSTVSSSMHAGVGPARSGGSNIGSNAKSGFQNAFKISQVASQELQNSITALQNGTSGFLAVVRDIAEKAVQEAKNASGQKSPGHIARMWGKEMDYSSMMIMTRGSSVINAVRTMTGRVVKSWNGGLGDGLKIGVNESSINGLKTMTQNSIKGKSQRPVSIHIGEGAIQLDARSMSKKESQQIMINALDGLDAISGIDVRGV